MRKSPPDFSEREYIAKYGYTPHSLGRITMAKLKNIFYKQVLKKIQTKKRHPAGNQGTLISSPLFEKTAFALARKYRTFG